MLQLSRTTSANTHFIQLVHRLDAELAQRDGDQHAFYNQFNKIAQLNHVIVALMDGVAVGCGALKPFDSQSMEVKRMYTLPAHRGRGVAGAVLAGLEQWAGELHYQSCVLETGKNQPEAIALYQKKGYHAIANYGPYAGVENSVCFQKILS